MVRVRAEGTRRTRRAAVALVALVVGLGVTGYRLSRPVDDAPPAPTVPEPTPGEKPVPVWKPPTAAQLALRPSPLDGRKRELLPAELPEEVVAVLGGDRFRLPKVGQHSWMVTDREGKFLAVPNADVVAIFDARTGELVQTLTGHSGRVYAVAFSPDGRFLAGGNRNQDHTIKIWDLTTGKVTAALDSHAGDIGSVAFNPDGTLLVSQGNGAVEVWDLKMKKVLWTREMRIRWSFQIAFSRDGKRFVCGDTPSKTARVFDANTGRLLKTLEGYSSEPRGAAFSADGKLLAIGSDNELILWDAEKLDQIPPISSPAGWLALEPDGKTILTARHSPGRPLAGDVVTRWNLTPPHHGKPLPPLSKGAGSPVYHLSPDGKTLYALIVDRPGEFRGEERVRAYDAVTGKDLFPDQDRVSEVWTVAVSPDGRTVASGSADGTVRLWDLAGWKAGDPQPPARDLSGHTATVSSVAFSPDGKLVASKSLDGTIRLWNAATGETVRTIPTHAAKKPSDVVFSADGKSLAAGDEDGHVRLWEDPSAKPEGFVASWEERPHRWHNGHVNSVAVSPDNHFLASVGLDDRKVHITDLRTKERVQTFDLPGVPSKEAEPRVAFAGDGRTLAYGGWDGTVRLWDLVAKKETVLTGGASGLDGLAVDPTGQFVAATRGGVLRLWDKGAPDRPLVIGSGAFGNTARHVAFTPEGRYVVVAGFNGTVSIVRTPTPVPPLREAP